MRSILSIVSLILVGCISNHLVPQSSSVERSEFVPVFGNGPQILVYKTKANYNNLVPLTLSEDKSKIISYPDPSDIKLGNNFLTPDTLINGYLIDNKGIGKNVAFLRFTYEEYSKLEKVPDLEELYKIIVDKDPVLELCDCGIKHSKDGLISQLIDLIEKNRLRAKCKIIR